MFLMPLLCVIYIYKPCLVCPQPCGRVSSRGSSWSAPSRPCSGSSTTRWRCTTACPARHPPPCQRASVWSSRLPPRAATDASDSRRICWSRAREAVLTRLYIILGWPLLVHMHVAFRTVPIARRFSPQPTFHTFVVSRFSVELECQLIYGRRFDGFSASGDSWGHSVWKRTIMCNL